MASKGVKITKSTIIQQIYQLEVYKLVNVETKLVHPFYNTFQAGYSCLQLATAGYRVTAIVTAIATTIVTMIVTEKTLL